MAIGLLNKGVGKPANSAKWRRGEDRDELFEMANLFPDDTGLPVTVWVSPRGRARHAARIKVSRVAGNRVVPSNTAVVRLEPEPTLIAGKLPSRYLEPVIDWARRNQEALLEYWNGQIGAGALIGKLQRSAPSARDAEADPRERQ